MKVSAVIAEYNPFHLGHLYQIRRIKERDPERELLVIMSGDFVQRGEPALVDKYRRGAAALQAGADLILELPAAYATAGAPLFARGAVGLAVAAGCVDELVFGTRGADTGRLRELAEKTELLLAGEGMQEALKRGRAYPSALEELLRREDPEGAELLRDPNNLLGMEYMKALDYWESTMSPAALERRGSGHGSLELIRGRFASAAAIRRALRQGAARESLTEYLPSYSLDKLDYCLYTEDLSAALSAVLLRLHKEDRPLTDYADVSESVESRIRRASPFLESFEALAREAAGRGYTLAHARRALLHILLDIRREEPLKAPRSLRILGLRQGASLPARIKSRAKLPVLTKMADADPALRRDYTEPREVYRQAVYMKTGLRLPGDYQQPPLVLEGGK